MFVFFYWHVKSSLHFYLSRLCIIFFSLLRQTVPIFSDVRFSYLALVQDKKITCVISANACCIVYVNCRPPHNAVGKIIIVLLLGKPRKENDWNLTLGCRRFPYLVLSPVLDSIFLSFELCIIFWSPNTGVRARNSHFELNICVKKQSWCLSGNCSKKP